MVEESILNHKSKCKRDILFRQEEKKEDLSNTKKKMEISQYELIMKWWVSLKELNGVITTTRRMTAMAAIVEIEAKPKTPPQTA